MSGRKGKPEDREDAGPESARRLPEIWADTLGRASIRSAQCLLVIALAVVLIWAATRVPLVLIPVLIAMILASAIAPLVRWLMAHRWPPLLAVLSCLVAIMVVMGGVVTGIVSLIQEQSAELAQRAVDGVEKLHGFLVTGPVSLNDQQISAAGDKLRGFLTSGTFSTEAISGLRVAGETVAGVVLVAVILFFFLKDGAKIRGFLIGFLPQEHRAKAYLAAEHSAVVLGGYVRGTAMIAAIDGLVVGIALVIIRVPLALPLGVFVFLGGFVPIIGATLAGSLAVLVALVSNGPVSALIVLAVLIGANQLEHHLLQPLLMGKVLHIHGLVILLALAAGAVLAGIIGALLAVPLTAVGWTVLKTWSHHAAEASEAADETPADGGPQAEPETGAETGPATT